MSQMDFRSNTITDFKHPESEEAGFAIKMKDYSIHQKVSFENCKSIEL